MTIRPAPITLAGHGVRLEPLEAAHEPALARAAADGELWNLVFTSVPEPGATGAYVSLALSMQAAGTRLPFVVRAATDGEIIGCTSYHDIVTEADRVEIGYTWYARRWQRTHVNTACKLLLMSHAFEGLGCGVVGWRTDVLNLASQRAIERLGARRDGVIRHNLRRRDGTMRDTVMYSLLADEWPPVRARLLARLAEG